MQANNLQVLYIGPTLMDDVIIDMPMLGYKNKCSLQVSFKSEISLLFLKTTYNNKE